MNIDCFDKNVLSSTLSIIFYTDNTKMKILEYTLESADIFIVISYVRLEQKKLFTAWVLSRHQQVPSTLSDQDMSHVMATPSIDFLISERCVCCNTIRIMSPRQKCQKNQYL